MDSIVASMLNVNPCTAYRMLKDFVALKEGDTVIQNGANSAVGQFVIQLCRLWGIKSINIIRERPDAQNLKVKLVASPENSLYSCCNSLKKAIVCTRTNCWTWVPM